METIPDHIWKQMTEEEQQEACLFLPLYTLHEGGNETKVYSYNTILRMTVFIHKMIDKYDKSK